MSKKVVSGRQGFGKSISRGKSIIEYMKLELNVLITLYDMTKGHLVRVGELIDGFTHCGSDAEFVSEWVSKLSKESHVSSEMEKMEKAILLKYEKLTGYSLDGVLVYSAGEVLENLHREKEKKFALGGSGKIASVNKPD